MVGDKNQLHDKQASDIRRIAEKSISFKILQKQ